MDDDVGAPAERGATRYDFEVDPTGSGSHARVVRLVGTGRTVLEVGAATGSTTRVLRANGCSVTAVEIDPEAAAAASAWADRLVVADLEATSLRDAVAPATAFDVVVAADVLEHLRSPLRVLREMVALTAEGGRCVVSVPNVAHGSVRLALLEGRWEYAEDGLLDRTHVHLFTKASLERLFDDAGLDLVELQRVERAVDDADVDFDPALLDTDAGRRVLADPESTAFQYVAVGVPRTGGVPRVAAARPERGVVEEQGALIRALRLRGEAAERAVAEQHAIIAHRTAYTEDLERQVRAQDVELNRLREELGALGEVLAETQRHLQQVVSSRAYKVADRARALAHRLPGR